MYTRENFLYTDLLEASTDPITQDFERVYGDISNLNVIKPPKQNVKANPEWTGSFAFFQNRNPQWDTYCQARSQFLKQLVQLIPYNYLQGIWFSAILPHGVIPWHVDKYEEDNQLVRVHLPLIVPEGDLGLTVGEVTHQWTKGRLICFDPFTRHTAWNKTDSVRLNVNFNFAREAFIC